MAYISIGLLNIFDAYSISIDHFPIEAKNLYLHRVDTILLGKLDTVAHPEITFEAFPFLIMGFKLSFFGDLFDFQRLEPGHLRLEKGTTVEKELVLLDGKVHDEVALDAQSPFMLAISGTGNSIRAGGAVDFDRLGGRVDERGSLVSDFKGNKESVDGQRQHAS